MGSFFTTGELLLLYDVLPLYPPPLLLPPLLLLPYCGFVLYCPCQKLIFAHHPVQDVGVFLGA
jgi:hypothetical protein